MHISMVHDQGDFDLNHDRLVAAVFLPASAGHICSMLLAIIASCPGVLVILLDQTDFRV